MKIRKYFVVKRLTSFVFIFGIITGTAQAQERFSWQDIREFALENNANIQGLKHKINSLEFQQKVSRASFLPSLDLSASYSHNETEGPGDSFTSSDGNNIGLNASYNLFNGFRDKATYESVQLELDAQKKNLREETAALLYQLRSAYEGLLYAQSSARLTSDIVKRREENYNIVNLRFESGYENKGSLLLSKAYLSQARLDALAAKNSIDSATQELRKAMGDDSDDDIELVGSIPLNAPGSMKVDLDSYIDSLPEYQALKAREAVAKKRIKIQNSSFYPGLTLTASAGRGYLNGVDSSTLQKSLALRFSLPLFEGGRNYYNRKSVIEDYKAAYYSTIDLRRALRAKIRQTYYAYRKSVLKLEADQEFQDAVLTRAKIARSKYNNGLVSFEDWDIIESDLINRQINLLQSKRQRSLAEGEWLKLLGEEI